MSLVLGAPACLFDLDGTCIDSDTLHFDAYREALQRADLCDGVPITREFYDREMSGKQNRVIMAELGRHLPTQAQNAVWLEKEKLYMRAVDQGVAPIRGLRALLDRLTAERIPHAIVTNAPRTQAMHTLNALQLAARFGERVVIGEECEKPKPWPHPYLDGLKLVGADASRTVAFEDSPSGIASARAANLYTVGVMSSRTEADLTAAGAHFCIRHFEDEILWSKLEARWQRGA